MPGSSCGSGNVAGLHASRPRSSSLRMLTWGLGLDLGSALCRAQLLGSVVRGCKAALQQENSLQVEAEEDRGAG